MARALASLLAAGLLGLLAASSVAATSGTGSAAAPVADWRYTVRPGDDLWRLALRYCGSTAYAERLARHNGLRSPNALRAGAALRIPVPWLVRQPAEVEVVSVTGSVADGAGTAYRPGDRIAMGQELVTTADALAVVVFADGSTLEIGPDSRVLFNILTSFGDTGMVDTHLRFYRGRGAASVIKREAASRFRIWTPSGIAAVRGTDFRVGASAGAAPVSRVETVTGEVGFAAPAQTVDLPAGFGVVASSTGTQKAALLPAPVIEDDGAPLPDGALLRSADQSVRWAPVAGAAAYQLELYEQRGRRFVPIRSLERQQTAFALADLAPGQYRLSVRAIAPSSLEGFDANTTFRLAAAAPEPVSAGQLVADEALRWRFADGGPATRYEVELGTDADLDNAGRYGTGEPTLPLADTIAAAPGHYFWRVREQNGAFSATREVAVLPRALDGLRAQTGSYDKARGAAAVELAWARQPDVRYRIRALRRDDGAVVSEQLVEDNRASVTLPAGGYRIEVTPVAADLAGTSAAAAVDVRSPAPRWMALLILLPALFGL
ncbi:MAG: FecR domain-containing protein [Pseudomonadota bacterium]